MSEPTLEYVRELATDSGFPRVTVHMPMDRAGPAVQKNRIRLKNAANTAQKRLVERGVDAQEAHGLVEPVRRLGEDDARMHHQHGGVSLFMQGDLTRDLEIAAPMPEVIDVGERFSVVELLRPVLENRDYAILTLSRGGVGLYRASRYAAELVELSGLPEDLCYVLRFDQFDAPGQHRTIGGRDDHGRSLARFIDAVEPLVTLYVEKNNLPLVLIGEEESVGHYSKRTNYHRVVPSLQFVDPHVLSLDDLIRRGWESMSREVTAHQRQQIDRFRGHDNSVRGIQAVLPAVAEGRVETLFLNPEIRIPGSFDRAHEHVEIAPDPNGSEENLANVAAVYALTYGTQIVPVGPSDGVRAPAAILY